jgi:beta-glucosidase
MRALGTHAYRFSISWSRVMPGGRPPVNAPGLDFYERLVDGLLANGIEPMVTLYHWDLPAALDDAGGWLNRDIAGWFADYASVVVRALGDRVPMWVTLNEPWVVSDAGYLHGTHAPGHQSIAETPRASHNLLRAHGAGMQAIRAEGGRQAGLVVNLEPKDPATDRPEDLAATARADAYMNRQFLDPVLLGRYPEEMPEIFGHDWPEFPENDFALIQQPIDFLGVNYYTRNVTCDDPAALPVRAGRVRQEGKLHTTLDWEVYPAALTAVLVWIRDRYGSLPLYITENGAAFLDTDPLDVDLVQDPLRVAYFRDHLLAVHEAIRLGVDLRGYFAWSLFDNFEWTAGFAKTFGLYRVDPTSQRRTPKASAHFYAEVIRSGGASLGR